MPAGREQRTWAWAAAIVLWLAFPPVGWWWLAWLAPCGWLRLTSRPEWSMSRPYLTLYFAGLLHWLLLVQWIRLPHWSAYFGWLALAGYLAVYVPLFVALTRVLVHRWGVSSCLAAPVVWTGLELARGHLLTGFSMSLIGHTQLPLLPLVQIADTLGAYGVSFVVVAVAACLERLLPQATRPRRRAAPLLAAMVLLAACWGYGAAQLSSRPPQANGDSDAAPRTLRAALIQGSLDTQFDGNAERVWKSYENYLRLSRTAVQQHPDVDVVIWPESMYTPTDALLSFAEPVEPLPEWEGTIDELRDRLASIVSRNQERMTWTAAQLGKPLIAGGAWTHVVAGQLQSFNSAVHLDAQGTLLGRYDKMHLVMFGEYVPFGKWFPDLYRLTPMHGGLIPGTGPQVFQVDGVRLAPTICFENTVPHLVRRQVAALQRRGESPQVLVTVTNDGWFWGSSLLDVHLACGVFRAIELRRPLLIAANTGFSAVIEPSGRIQHQGPRRADGVIIATVPIADPPPSRYLRGGDWFAGLCLAISCAATVLGYLRPSRSPPSMANPPGFVDSEKLA